MKVAQVEASDLRTTETPDGSRVSATVDGEELYLESADLPLRCSPELFGSVLLPVAVHRGARLRLDRAPDPVWRRNVAGALDVWARWWGTEPDLDRVLVAPPSRRPARAARRAGDVALCFSLGVDSFHTLLRSGQRIDRLVLAEGFDIPLGDDARMGLAERSLREVADATGTRAIVIRTNLRRHPSFRRMAWSRTHGGSMAALGHACGDEIGELLISSTKPYGAGQPWGSHWETDPRYSSSRIAVRHVGAERHRNEKLAELVAEPLVREHVRVCWENRSSAGNCGECEKCVRTMLMISVGGGGEWPAFPSGHSLVDLIDGVERIGQATLPIYERLLAEELDARTRAALDRLLERSADRAAA